MLIELGTFVNHITTLGELSIEFRFYVVLLSILLRQQEGTEYIVHFVPHRVDEDIDLCFRPPLSR